jgi:hypothetical protein
MIFISVASIRFSIHISPKTQGLIAIVYQYNMLMPAIVSSQKVRENEK